MEILEHWRMPESHLNGEGLGRVLVCPCRENLGLSVQMPTWEGQKGQFLLGLTLCDQRSRDPAPSYYTGLFLQGQDGGRWQGEWGG